MKNKWTEKFVALCDSGKPWYAFLTVFSVLLAFSALVELFTEQHIKWWVWALDVLGILHSLVSIARCKLAQAKKADAE